MFIKYIRLGCLLFFATIFAAIFASNASAADEMKMDKHAPSYFHAFNLQMDAGAGLDDQFAHWDLDGWLGNDDNKLWLKSEGEKNGSVTEQSELWALYSHNIDTFWDLQAGIRHDTQPESTDYFVIGINGLAPYFFETQAHLFVGENGEVTARLREENDFLLTQQWILKPYAEINLDPGNSDGDIGLQLRYEITRRFAPYLDLHHTRSDHDEDMIVSAGFLVIF